MKISNCQNEKTIKIREKLTIKNLKTIITKELNLSKEWIEAFGEKDVLKDHQQIIDTELKDGDEIVINWHIKNYSK